MLGDLNFRILETQAVGAKTGATPLKRSPFHREQSHRAIELRLKPPTELAQQKPQSLRRRRSQAPATSTDEDPTGTTGLRLQ